MQSGPCLLETLASESHVDMQRLTNSHVLNTLVYDRCQSCV